MLTTAFYQFPKSDSTWPHFLKPRAGLEAGLSKARSHTAVVSWPRGPGPGFTDSERK